MKTTTPRHSGVSRIKASLLGLAVSIAVSTAGHSQELVVNGGFEDYLPNSLQGPLEPFHAWSFVYTPQTIAVITGVMGPGTIGRQGVGILPAPTPQAFNVYGPTDAFGNGGNYSGTVESMESPSGGNFLLMDGDPNYAAFLTQTISGLVIGGQYELTFDWAAGQLVGFDGPTTESWAVKFGDESYHTEFSSNAEHDFRPWQAESVTFTATATSQVLSFIAEGTPVGFPPISLLDNVSILSVPEPGCVTLVTAFSTLALFKRRRKP